MLFFSYNNATGEFTVPPGGDGLYFFYINFFADDADITNFVVRVNGVRDLCYARADMNNVAVSDNGTPSCGAVATVSAGKGSKGIIKVELLFNVKKGIYKYLAFAFKYFF